MQEIIVLYLILIGICVLALEVALISTTLRDIVIILRTLSFGKIAADRDYFKYLYEEVKKEKRREDDGK